MLFDSVRLYRPLPAFSRDEERQLLVRAQAGDRAAKDLLVRSQVQWAARVATKWARGDQDTFDDCLAEAMAGIAHAVDRYDLACTSEFITYATYWIRAMLLNRHRADSTVYVPVRHWGKGGKFVGETIKAATTSLDVPLPESDTTRMDLHPSGDPSPSSSPSKGADADILPGRHGGPYGSRALSHRGAVLRRRGVHDVEDWRHDGGHRPRAGPTARSVGAPQDAGPDDRHPDAVDRRGTAKATGP